MFGYHKSFNIFKLQIHSIFFPPTITLIFLFKFLAIVLSTFFTKTEAAHLHPPHFPVNHKITI